MTSRWCQWHCEYQSCIRGFTCVPLWPSNDFIHCLAICFKFPTTCINCSTTNLARWHWEYCPPSIFWLLLCTMLVFEDIHISSIYMQPNKLPLQAFGSSNRNRMEMFIMSCTHLSVVQVWRSCLWCYSRILCILFFHLSPHLLRYIKAWLQ